MTLKSGMGTDAVEGCQVVYLLVTALELRSELRDDLVGQHYRDVVLDVCNRWRIEG